jgi:hypothetical protein
MWPAYFEICRNVIVTFNVCLSRTSPLGEKTMDSTTVIIIIVLILLLGGGGYYGRGRWF